MTTGTVPGATDREVTDVLVFIIRRLIVSFFVLLAATAIVYILTAVSGDPLADLREDQSPNRAQKIAQREEFMLLDVPPPARYLLWLRGVGGCLLPFMECDLGQNRFGQDVSSILGLAMSSTLRLVLTAALVAIVIGITVGIVSALRQYSGFDYSITFAAFVFFSLPSFWVAVLLKQYGAIAFNDWLRDPVIPVPVVVVVALLSGIIWMAVIGGDRKRRLITFASAAVGTALVLVYLSATRWFATPSLGIALIAASAIGIAFLVTALVSGLAKRRVLYAALASAGVGIISFFATQPVLINPSWWHIVMLVAITVAVGIAIGYLVGGIDKGQAGRAAVLTGLLTGGLIFWDHVLLAVPGYSGRVGGRVVSTIGSNTPNFTGDFWQTYLDNQTHLVLPTIALILISFATYTRFTRASMLEVMNQDYVRTARSKGLTERTVIMRHAFRNALIPVTTLMAFDFAGIVGGAIITEKVFGWKGMGTMFREGLGYVDPNTVMAFFIVTGTAIVVFNMIADILYAYLDPRIRLS
jgi:peptide/nickel transport system permease protein